MVLKGVIRSLSPQRSRSKSPTRDRSRSPRRADSEASTAEERPKKSLLARLGGRDVLNNVVDKFIHLITSDEKLMYFFEGVDHRSLSLHQKRFLAMAFTKLPSGIETIIKANHQPMFAKGLNGSHFDVFVEDLMKAMTELGIEKDLTYEAVGVIAPLRPVFEEGAKAAS